MIALSTSWKSSGLDDGEALLQAVERFDVSAIELEYRITEAMFQQMRQALKRSDLQVVSLHNFFPHPGMMPRSMASGDLFLLSHPHKEERQRAVQWTVRTIEHATDLEASAVVLHCGYVDMDSELDVLRRYLKEDRIHSDEAGEFIRSKLAEREEKSFRYLDNLLFSLERLIRTAERYGIGLGLENRYGYHELPGMTELDIIFSEFSGGPVGYWHDTGHAHANEVFTLVEPEALLKKYADKLIGVHFHDARGGDDHLPLGTGEINFEAMRPYLKEETLRVVELKPGTSDSEVSESLEFLREKGIS